MLIQVGEEYPAIMPVLHEPSAVIVMEEDLFGLVFYTPAPAELVRSEWRNGTYKYAIFIEDNIPFFILFYEKAALLTEASIDFLVGTEHGHQTCDFLLGKSERFTMTLVDANNNIVKAIRQFDFGPTSAKMLRDACINQTAGYKTSAEVCQKIYSIFGQYSTEDMFLKGERFQPAG
jgi:hypothetical protein